MELQTDTGSLHHTWDRQQETGGVTKTVVGLTEGVTVDV